VAEKITFHFEGGLSDRHRMNFYEASRFQYAAARLMVKLAQFRREGKFVQNITDGSNFNIVITSHAEGSFDINTEAPEAEASDKKFVNLTLGDMLSYVSERLLQKTDEKDVKSSIQANAQVSSSISVSEGEDEDQLDDILEQLRADPELLGALHSETREVVERRLAEMERQAKLDAAQSEIAKIDAAREQKLISMSAPLVREMAVALRRSAKTLKVVSTAAGKGSSVVYLSQQMASDIEDTKVDREITAVYCDIVQYNKDYGSGKMRLLDRSGVFGFSIPSDLKHSLQSKIVSGLDSEEMYLQTYFVRDKARALKRLIVVGVLPIPVA